MEKKHILIIDDEKVILELMKSLLDQNLFKITCCDNSQKALELLDSQYFHLILLDLMLPEISGIDILQELQRQHTNKFTPVIMISGRNDEDSIQKALDNGATDYVIKPFSHTELSARIRAALRLKDREDLIREQKNKLLKQSIELLEKNNHLRELLGELQNTQIISENKSFLLKKLSHALNHDASESNQSLYTLLKFLKDYLINDLPVIKFLAHVLEDNQKFISTCAQDAEGEENRDFCKILSAASEPLKTTVADLESIANLLKSLELFDPDALVYELEHTTFYHILSRLYESGIFTASAFKNYLRLINPLNKGKNKSGTKRKQSFYFDHDVGGWQRPPTSTQQQTLVNIIYLMRSVICCLPRICRK